MHVRILNMTCRLLKRYFYFFPFYFFTLSNCLLPLYLFTLLPFPIAFLPFYFFILLPFPPSFYLFTFLSFYPFPRLFTFLLFYIFTF